MKKRKGSILGLLVAGLSLACLAVPGQAQDGGWQCGNPPATPGLDQWEYLTYRDSVPMVVIFGWMPSDTEAPTKKRPLPSWFYSYMDTHSVGAVKSIPRWYKDHSYDPVLGRSRHVIWGAAYGDSNNTYYFRSDSTRRYYDRFPYWAPYFHRDILAKADQVIDFSRYVKNPNDPLELVAKFLLCVRDLNGIVLVVVP